MSYFVVERSGESGELRIPLPTAFETREAAIAALSAATGSGEVTLVGEVFIADLGGAVPVLVMAAAPPAPAEPQPEPMPTEESAPEEEPDVVAEPAEQPVGEAAEAEEPEVFDEPAEEAGVLAGPDTGDFIIEEPVDEPASLDATAAEEVYSSWEPAAEVAAGGTSLADALKRAATTLEGEGVVAPESVLGAADEEAEAPDLVPADESEAEEAAEDVAVGGAEEEWPWANIESYEVPAEAGEPASEDTVPDVVETTPGVSESAGAASSELDVATLIGSLGEDAPIITSAPPEGEEAYMPHPVILGDYADAPAEIDSVAVDEESVEAEESGDAVSEPVEEVPAGAIAGDSDVSLESGYAPTGELDLGEYTCQDCVYSNTCPKVGQVTPAECGSFQWKSE